MKHQNSGHGWVYPLPGGAKARCGGPALCQECARDLAQKQAEQKKRDEYPWLPIALCPTDGVDRLLLLPDGREVVGAFHSGNLVGPQGWITKTPFEHDEPVYEYPLRGGLIIGPMKPTEREPERKKIGTRKAITWIVGKLPEGIYPTHFRPNDTVYGHALIARNPVTGNPIGTDTVAAIPVLDGAQLRETAADG